VARELGTDRFVRHLEGDIATTALSGRYDVVFLGNLLHHLVDSTAATVLSKIEAATVPGGTIAVWDLVDTSEASVETACFSLLFYLTSGAGCPSESDVTALLDRAGYRDIRTVRPPKAPTHVLFTGRKRPA
jgi:hypothetical protein